MIKFCILLAHLLLFYSLTSFGTENATQKRLKNNKTTLRIIGDEKPVMIRIPPPDSYLNKSATLSGGAKIYVTYTGFTTQAKNAFQKAVDIWASQVYSPVKIKIDATWRTLEESVLGSCGSSDYFMDQDGLPYSNTYYPVALAEKLTGENLNDSVDFEMIANFNKNVDWYLKSDGNTPSTMYDFISVVLHEICHGLGFISSFSVDRGLGSWGWGSQTPIVYDRYVIDSWNNSLLSGDIYPNNSLELKEALTSKSLYFNSPLLNAEFGKSAILYAPGSWESGSSISHVSSSYGTGTESMMTYSINKGKSIHDPGVLARSILDELGWKQLRIVHDAIINSEEISNVNISAKIFSDFSTPIINPKLHFSKDSSEYIELGLKNSSNDSTLYSATIPITKNVDVSYYLTADDKYGRSFHIPVSSPEINYHFFVGIDTIPPVIKHYQNNYLLPLQDSIPFIAVVTDGFGVDTVWLEYSFNGVIKSNVPLKKMKNNKYQVILDISSFHVEIGDSLNYRILARDKSKAGNLQFYPSEGTIKMKVEPIPDFVESLINDFENINNDFILQGFEIIEEAGFTNNALHSIHPYEFAGENNSLDYFAQIRFPIIIDDKDHFLSFDEIVLVEPGEPGSVYGNDDFYDYVVAEASKDNGNTWLALEPGWDCRFSEEWNSVYNQSISKQFSQAIGTPSMFKNHSINLIGSGDFDIGDKILVRFRLHSDPYAYGWGWAIDNLKVQTVGLSNKKFELLSGFKVYPNPLKGNILTVDTNGEKISEAILFNFHGDLVFKSNSIGNENFIELPERITGSFILQVKTEKQTVHFKILVD
jgi:hypothetical protein